MKEDFIKLVTNRNIKCALLTDGRSEVKLVLGYFNKDFDKFLADLAHLNSDNLSGTVWFWGGAWAIKEKGSAWVVYATPEIPRKVHPI